MKEEKILAEFGRRVQFFRKERGLSQAGLAEKSGKSEDTISNIERGQKSTKIETAINIAQALDVTLAELFDLPLFDPAHKAKSEIIRKHIALLIEHDEEFIQFVHDQTKATANAFRTDKK